MDSENKQKSVKKHFNPKKDVYLPLCGSKLFQNFKSPNFPVHKTNKQRRSIFLSKLLISQNHEHQENAQLKNAERLAPIERSNSRKRKSAFLGKNKTLLYMIENYFDSQTTILTVDKDVRDSSQREFGKDGYESTVDNCCGSGFKEYQNDLEKNLMIEKLRLGNYKRNRRRSIV